MRRPISSWSQTLSKLGFRRKPKRSHRKSIYHRRPTIEGLESRELLSITVNTLVDETNGIGVGGISLRDAIAAATPNETIDFSVTGTIHLGSQLTINKSLVIDGPGRDLLTISGDNQTRVFMVNSGVTATIQDLKITGGNSDGGGGVYTFGDLTLNSVSIEDNTTINSGAGGGIFAFGSLKLDSSIVQSNHAAGAGGGIYVNNSAHATITNSTIDDNEASSGGGVYGYLLGNDSLIVQSSTVSNNRTVGTGGVGGGLTILGTASGATAKIVNSTISNNTASYSGGIRIIGNTTHVDMVNSTVAYNQGNESGGIQLNSGAVTTINAFTVNNTIVAENRSASGADSNVLGTLDSTNS